MKIMIDTNILISALIFPSSQLTMMLSFISDNHTLVISSYVIDEFREVIQRKFPNKEKIIDELFLGMSFEIAYTPKNIDKNLFTIRDMKDYPVLYTAICDGSDILITGDKDFADIDIDFPLILTPSEFVKKYIS